MPTYEYLCQTCSHRFETWQKMTDDPLTTCPECGSQIRRILFPAGIVFKGSGFYKTDHNGNGSPTASSDGDNKKTETENSSNGDTKKTETISNGDAKKAETSSNSDTKKAESNPSSSTSTSESKSTTTTATK
ncbi:MAG TPA: FmdB family zinc ribbon protein [Ktedonobacteraceae bacterium]|nr:FmdB family zinc ribbon protein [Ktedonobacteraceae bacterium]